MTKKYTPGPWKIIEDTFVYALNEKGINQFSLNIQTQYGGAGKEETKANARLISCAPELLEALEDCVEVLQFLEERTSTRVNPPTLDKAKAIINKSRGE